MFMKFVYLYSTCCKHNAASSSLFDCQCLQGSNYSTLHVVHRPLFRRVKLVGAQHSALQLPLSVDPVCCDGQIAYFLYPSVQMSLVNDTLPLTSAFFRLAWSCPLTVTAWSCWLSLDMEASHLHVMAHLTCAACQAGLALGPETPPHSHCWMGVHVCHYRWT